MSCLRIEHLAKLFPSQTGEVLDLVLAEMDAAGLTAKREVAAAFLAQIGHESVDLRYTREIGGEKRSYAPWFGRGYIQVTWPGNYAECAEATGIDCVHHPELLEAPEGAIKSAIWFYTSKGLHKISDFDVISRRINGAGITEASKADRRRRYQRALEVLAT